MKRLSIIIPVLNEESAIRDCLLKLQPYRQLGHEIIVVDGGSSDQTSEIASHLSDKCLHSEPGRARQMNTGAAKAKGDILLFLHVDTFLPKNADEIIISGLESEKNVWGRFDVRLSGKQPLLKVIAFFMNTRSRLTGIATGDQAMFVTQKTFVKLNGFPEISLMEDICFSRKLLSISRPLCISEKLITSSRRWEQKGIVRTVILMWYLRVAHFFGKSPEDLARIYSS